MANVRENQVVWYWKDGQKNGAEPEPAIVTRLYEGDVADLWIFCFHGAQRVETKVPLAIGDDHPNVRFATIKAYHDAPSATTKVG